MDLDVLEMQIEEIGIELAPGIGIEVVMLCQVVYHPLNGRGQPIAHAEMAEAVVVQIDQADDAGGGQELAQGLDDRCGLGSVVFQEKSDPDEVEGPQSVQRAIQLVVEEANSFPALSFPSVREPFNGRG